MSTTTFTEDLPGVTISSKSVPPLFLIVKDGGGRTSDRSSATSLEEVQALVEKQIRAAGGQTKRAYVYKLVFAEEHVHSSTKIEVNDLVGN